MSFVWQHCITVLVKLEKLVIDLQGGNLVRNTFFTNTEILTHKICIHHELNYNYVKGSLFL